MGEGEILCECAGKVFGGSNWSQTGQYEEADISTVSVSVSPETKCSSLTLFGNDKPATTQKLWSSTRGKSVTEADE